MVKIRQATIGDTPGIKSMMRNLFLTWHKIDEMDRLDENWFLSAESDELISGRIGSDDKRYYVAEIDGKIIGYIFGLIEFRAACKDKNIGLVDELFVAAEYRKKGAAGALTNKMIEWFKSKNAKWSIVLTHSLDSSANSYWKNFGYEKYNVKYQKRV